MKARNGKPAVTEEKIRIIKEAVLTGSIRDAAYKAGVAYSTAWYVVNGNTVRVREPKIASRFFEHDNSYRF